VKHHSKEPGGRKQEVWNWPRRRRLEIKIKPKSARAPQGSGIHYKKKIVITALTARGKRGYKGGWKGGENTWWRSNFKGAKMIESYCQPKTREAGRDVEKKFIN